MFQAAIMVIVRLYDHPMIIFIFNIWIVYLRRPYISRQGPWICSWSTVYLQPGPYIADDTMVYHVYKLYWKLIKLCDFENLKLSLC